MFKQQQLCCSTGRCLWAALADVWRKQLSRQRHPLCRWLTLMSGAVSVKMLAATATSSGKLVQQTSVRQQLSRMAEGSRLRWQ
jgi:hypothetical protein